jgi:sensor histidine kinase YesM
MEQLRRYLSISQAREGDKLTVVLDIPEALFECRLPAFCLQPLAENALQHGLHPKESGGTLCIRARRESDVIHFEVEDDGVGMKELPKLSAREAGSHIGLVNVQARLRSLYGAAYGLTIESTLGKGTCVHMRIPYEKVRGNENEDNTG